MRSSDKKTSLNVISTSTFNVERKVILQSVEERTYHSKNEKTGKVSDYYRYIVVLGDREGKNIFGSQLAFCLNPKEDTGIAPIKEAKIGTNGTAVFEIRYFVKDEGVSTDKETGEISIIPFTHETEVNLIDFIPAK